MEPMTRRERAHERRRAAGIRRFPLGWALLAALLVLLLCLGGALAARGGGDEGSACAGDPITVAATPEIAEPLEQALAKVREADECADFEVAATSAAQAAENINEDRAPDVWIPDSSTWIDALDSSSTAGRWVQGESIASSPISLAVGATGPGASSIPSWAGLLNEEGALRMANPDVDTASRLAFHASRSGQPGPIGLQAGKRLIFMSRFAAPSVNALFEDYTGQPKESDPFPASEQAIFAYNEEHPSVDPLRAIVPAKGTLSLDYPWIFNPELSGAALATADRARIELGTLEVRASLAKAGFRDAGGQRGPRVADRWAPVVTDLEPLDRSARIAAVEQWDVMRTDMRMLAVIDVSGSMQWDSPTPGLTRWDVAKGALVQGIDMLPDGSRVGGWIFSSDLGPNRDYQELSPVRQLDATVGSGTHRDHLRRLISNGDKYIGGDTGLYDSIWAAHQEMVGDYDEDYVNSIVVFTDGENDDPNGGLSLTQLLRKLKDDYDPERPVRIITIGMGEADLSALREISQETGGTSYLAETPDDIERVFVQALLARERS